MIPDFLLEKLNNDYSHDIVLDITNSYIKERKTTLRVNTIKSCMEEVKEILTKKGFKYSEVEWSNFSLIIENKTSEDIKTIDAYKTGKIYLQNLSSQLPPIFVEPKTSELILDMTAAPGGKTTELAALSNNESLITAIEKNKKRFERLKYNIDHLDAKKISVLNVDARNLDEYFMFDKILLDAPCSGSGTLNISTMDNFTEELIERSIMTQKNLIREAIKHLKLNGELVYSTCSILKEENENIIIELLNENESLELIPLDITEYNSIPKLPVKLEGTLCVKPNELYEGFFVAKIRKKN